MPQTKVRSDDKGIYVRTDGKVFRPGEINGYSHAYIMNDGGLSAGDPVKAHHMAGTPLCKITLANDIIIVWGTEYLLSLG